MKISDLGEFGLIGRIQKLAPRKSSSTLIGIGDDSAALKLPASRALLITTDLLIEGVHFDLSYTDFFSLGWKSASVNLSDIAAMGGIPRFCLTALGIPAGVSVEQITEFYRGFNALLKSYRTTLIGGDTCSSRKGLFISVTALGEVEPKRIITRAGARPGDRIFVTGTLGDSAAGLELLQMRNAKFGKRSEKSEIRNSKSALQILIARHLRPVPRVKWGRKIALSGCASAMIDLSDGLSSDLLHICEQSGVGAEISSERIPLSGSLLKASGQLKKQPRYYALSGGEDYEILFTVPGDKAKKLQTMRIPATEIGRVTGGSRPVLIDADGRKKALRPTGYDHFGRQRAVK
ncbi:MAG TPA: thiamine-phosphate kinase [Nitrospirota bacterium]|nr:thiamine-phosphate kinase [Nitrospirota bacterium]